MNFGWTRKYVRFIDKKDHTSQYNFWGVIGEFFLSEILSLINKKTFGYFVTKPYAIIQIWTHFQIFVVLKGEGCRHQVISELNSNKLF